MPQKYSNFVVFAQDFVLSLQIIFPYRLIDMLNRRFLRVKALQSIYAYHQSESSNLPQAEKLLLAGVDDLYKLFVYQLSFWVEIRQFAERRIEENKQKHFPTEEDLNPNMKFVDNRILKALDDNQHLTKLVDQYKIDWTDSREDFIRQMFVKLTETPEYQEYMNNGKDGFSDDKHFLATVIDTYMPENGLLYDYYSDRDLSYTSDYQLAIYLLWKYISELPADFNANSMLPPVFKDEAEDKEFVVKLFEKTILHADEYMEMVKDNISNWDYDRLALMDKILIFMALTEFIEFHSIPVKVTINEYIEISKFYSTPESRRFVNGMLDRLSTELKEKGRLVKTGLGLVDK
jgi:N utilization substance protein B